MKLTAKLLVIGVVAALAVSGFAVVMMASSNATADDSPTVTVTSDVAAENGTAPVHNMTVQVMCKVNGTRAAVAGVNVTVCMMNITKDGNRTTVEVIEVAKGQTDENGTITFVLPEGKYFVFAEHNGLRGFCRGNLGEDVMLQIKMHHWNWGHMKGQKFQYMYQEQNCNSNASCHDCDGTMDRTRDRDRLQDGTGAGMMQGSGAGHR